MTEKLKKKVVRYIKEHPKESMYLAIGIGSFIAGIFVGKALGKR